MRDPEAIPQAPGPGRWSACDLLAATIGGEAPRRHVLRMGEGFDGVDECGLYRRSKGALALTGASFGLIEPDFSALLAYDPDYAREQDTVIRGHDVEVTGKKPCEYSWQQWPVVNDSHYPGAVVITAPTCRQAADLTKAAMRALDGPPRPRSKVPPQRPLLYEFDEPDVPVVGACIDLNPDAWYDCRPYARADVPDDPVELVRQAEADRNVNCALAIDAVREHFGDRMRAVTVERLTIDAMSVAPPQPGACVFVDPSHAVEVWVKASAMPLSSTAMGSRIDRVAGHEAVRDRLRSYYQFVAVALGGADDRGQLIVGVTRQPTESGQTRAAKDAVGMAGTLAADLTRTHL